MKMLPALFLVLALGCAQSVRYDQFPPPAPTMTPAQLMVAKPCTRLPLDHYPNVNLTPGWSMKKPAAGMAELSCGDKYLPSIYCASMASCPKSMTWGTNTPVNMKAQDIHWVVDVLKGSISACAQQSGRFGVGSLACKRTTCAAMGDMPTRCVFDVQVLGTVQSQGPTEMIIDAASDGGLVIGAISPAEVVN